jgi:hypothetical protein
VLFNCFTAVPFWTDSNWTVNENNYQYTMTLLGFLNSDGNGLVNLNDKVAARKWECRVPMTMWQQC